jgi:hypothetical protein
VEQAVEFGHARDVVNVLTLHALGSLVFVACPACRGDAVPDDGVVRDVLLVDHVSEQLAVGAFQLPPRPLVVAISKPVRRKIALATPLAVFLYNDGEEERIIIIVKK